MNAVRPQGWHAYLGMPTLFWFGINDGLLKAACVAGGLSALVMASGRLTRPASACCWVLYLSIAVVGQPFSNFQWDALLLECGFLAIFLGVPLTAYAFRFLLFRLMFESGLVKLTSHDPTWHNLSALRYHFFTQPLPNPLAYYANRLPVWTLDSMTLLTLVVELVAPLFLFGTRRMRTIATGALLSLQVLILLTGNYAFFNLLTLALCFWGLDDHAFEPLRNLLRAGSLTITQRVPRRILTTCVAVLIGIGFLELAGMLVPGIASISNTFLPWVESFEVVNQYGLFAVMTTTRTELVIEGSDDGVNWREYQFRYKPGETNRELPIIAPYQPRLDWQMWFAALGSYEQNTWVGGLVYRLLLGDPAVQALLQPSPFSKPPASIRILAYDYRFTDPAERVRTGAIWQRKLLGPWLNPVSLKH